MQTVLDHYHAAFDAAAKAPDDWYDTMGRCPGQRYLRSFTSAPQESGAVIKSAGLLLHHKERKTPGCSWTILVTTSPPIQLPPGNLASAVIANCFQDDYGHLVEARA